MPFYIQSMHSGKYLDIKGGNKHKGAQVIIWDFNGARNQQWTYKKGMIISKLNGCVIYKCLNDSVSFPIPFFVTPYKNMYTVTLFMKLNNIKTVNRSQDILLILWTINATVSNTDTRFYAHTQYIFRRSVMCMHATMTHTVSYPLDGKTRHRTLPCTNQI